MIIIDYSWNTQFSEVVNPDDLKDESGGKIMFKKPKKRCNDNLDSNVNKKKKSEAKKQVLKDKSKGLKNTKLLSFDCNDDDETWICWRHLNSLTSRRASWIKKLTSYTLKSDIEIFVHMKFNSVKIGYTDICSQPINNANSQG